jgi:hypothetical protein
MFHAYCYDDKKKSLQDEDGNSLRPVALEDEEAVYQYVSLQRKIHYCVRIMDSLNDTIVLETVNNVITFPPELKGQ